MATIELRSWTVAFWAVAGILGFNGGLTCFDLWGRSYDPAWQWAAGGAGALVALLILSTLHGAKPAFIPTLLSRIKVETSGGWPWQQGSGWWIPFVLALPVAILVGLYFSSRYFALERLPTGVGLLLITTIGNVFLSWVPTLAIACYGLSLGRRWARVLAVALIVLGLVASALLSVMAFLDHYVEDLMSAIAPALPAVILVLPIPVACAILCVKLGLRFLRELRSIPPSPPPPPTAASPWSFYEVGILVLLALVPMSLGVMCTLVGGILSEVAVVLMGKESVTLSLLVTPAAALVFAAWRGDIKGFLLGREGVVAPRAEVAKTSAAFLLFLLPAIFCHNPAPFFRILDAFPLPSLPPWTLVKSVVLMPAAAEIVTRGVLWEFFSRSFGAHRALAFITVFSCSFSGLLTRYYPGFVAFDMVLALSLTTLRYRTGSLLACIVVRVTIAYLSSF